MQMNDKENITKPTRIAIVCFSAISNVAAIVPQLYSLTKRYPEKRFIIVSRSYLKPLFSLLDNTIFIGADIRGTHSSAKGIYLLFKELQKQNPDILLDMQLSWRTKFLSLLCSFNKIKTYNISAELQERKKLIQKGAGKYHPIKTIFQLQEELYKKCGLVCDNTFESLPEPNDSQNQRITELYGKKEKQFWVGIAPFSMAKGKTLPLKKMKSVLSALDKEPNTRIFLFGAGEIENEMLNDWQTIYRNVHAVHTKLKLDEELSLMHHLDVMLTMDSANMHLASLMAVPVVSIWGASHPFAGFLGWKQDINNCIGVDFSCRPCTIHKDASCKYGDYRCIESIHSIKIINTLLKFKPKQDNNG